MHALGPLTADDNLFRRDALDQGTIELLANAAARSWIDGQILLRGRGTGMLRDGLPAFLVAQYLGERFGQALQVEAWESFRRAYATIARSDAPLLMQSQLDRNYTTSIFNKGAMVWRLLESAAGQSIFRTAVETLCPAIESTCLSLAIGARRSATFRGALVYETTSRRQGQTDAY
jgi:hypothetical protein